MWRVGVVGGNEDAEMLYRLACKYRHPWIHVSIYDWHDARMDGWMDEWMDRWMDGWMDGCMDTRTHRHTDGLTHGYMDGLMSDRQMAESRDGKIDGWMITFGWMGASTDG